MSYGVVSPTTSAQGAKISIPLKGFTFSSVGSNPDVASSQVVGTAPTDTLVITMVNPLAAGSAGNVTVQLQFPCGTTCNGQVGTIQARFSATNASSPVSSGTTSLTASAINPNYQVNVVQTSYNATTRRAIFSVRVTPTTTPTNFLPLDTPVLSMTAPAGAIVRQYGTSGTRTTIPNNLPSSNFTPTSTTSTSSGSTAFTWTNIPIFYRGGRLDVTNVELEFPEAQFPYGTVVSIPSSMTGVLGAPGCTTTITNDTGLNTFTISAPGSITAGASGCSGQQMITGLNNPWSAVFTGKQNQTRISVPISNTGNVTLSNLTYTIPIPTNELSVTQVSGTGSGGVSGTAFYRTNLNPTYVSVGTVGNGITTRTFPTTLSIGEYITEVRVTVTTIAAGSNMTVNVFANQLSPLRDGSAVNAAPLASFMTPAANQNSCFGGYTCITAQATVTAEYSGTLILNQTCSSSRVVVKPDMAGIQNLGKAVSSTATSYVPGQVLQYRIRFTPATTSDSLRNLVLTDVLPSTLQFVGNVKYSNTTTAPTGTGSFSTSATPLPQFSRSGQTLTWSWAANTSPNNRINSTSDHYIYFDVRIKAGTAVGSIQNCITATGSNLYGSPVAGSCVSISVSSLAKIDAIKWVRGDLDRNYTRYPRIGHTTDGGKSDYRFVLTNTGNVSFKNIVLIDIFPWVGDQIVAADFERLSEWRPSLLQSIRFYPKAAADSSNVQVSPTTAPASITVLYSTQKNPCRTEFSPAYSPAGCQPGVWTTTPPASISTTQAIKMLIPGPFVAGDTLVFGSDMRSPMGTELNKVAWNSFAYQATRNDNNVILPVAEPNKVGIDVKRFPAIGNYVWDDLNGNGRQDEAASAGVNGVTVQLWSPGGDGQRGGTDDFLVGTKLTVNDSQGQPGYYRFDSLYAEPYYLRFAAPIGKGFTFQNASGVADSLNSDTDYQTGWTTLTVLDPDEQDFTWDAGLCTVPNAGPDLVLCAPTTTVKLADATGTNQWYAVGTNPPGATINAQTGQVAGLSSGVYQFILRSSPGCSDTVTVNRRPPATILTSALTACVGQSTTLTAQASGASATYAWTGPNGYSASGQSVVLNNLTTAQTGSYTLTVTDMGCTSTASVAIRVDTPVQLTTQPSSCTPATNLYNLTGVVTLNQTGGGGTLVVSDGSRSQTITVGTSQTTAAYSLTGLVSGSGTHTVTAAFTNNVCGSITITYVAPASCSCVVSATATAGSCQFNQTNTTTADDYFLPIIRATNTVPGATNRYEVVLNANPDGTGGTVLNPGGTTYEQSVTVGNPGQFLANGTSSYALTIRDINSATCRTTQVVGPVAPCSSCEAVLCPKVSVAKQAR